MITNQSIDIDKVGRIVLPKPVRDQFRLGGGSRLSLRVESNAIVLEPEQVDAALIHRNGLLVFGGKAKGDLMRAVEDSRNQRDRTVGGVP